VNIDIARAAAEIRNTFMVAPSHIQSKSVKQTKTVVNDGAGIFARRWFGALTLLERSVQRKG
jgi:hypothetical protein